MKKYITEFKLPKTKLTLNQKKVLDLLTKTAKLVADLYETQLKNSTPGAISFPKGVSREEIVKAAEKDKQILSPYTVVEKVGKNLIAIPYHEKYAKQLKEISEKLVMAAKITDDSGLTKYLNTQSQTLLNGEYEKGIIAWMERKPSFIDITIGPIERYDDELFFTKTAYQVWVGVMDKKETDSANLFKTIILSSQRKVLMPSEHIKFFDKVQTRVDDTLIFSGLIAKFGFTGTNLPNNTTLMEKHGSRISIFKPSLESWFEKKHFPIFETVFEKRFKQGYKQKNLLIGSLRNILLHELGHSFMRYRDAEKRLGNLFPVIDEIAASVLGVKACGSMLVMDVINQKELENIMVMFIVRLFDWLDQVEKDPSVVHYLKGNAIALNYLFNSGALKQKNGIYWPNFSKMFIVMNELAEVLDRLLSVGTYKDAELFIQKHGSLEVFKPFKTTLKTLL